MAEEKTNKNKIEEAGPEIVVKGENKLSPIQEFRQSIVEHGVGVMPKHSFLVVFDNFFGALGEVLTGYSDYSRENLMFRCESAQLPGVTALKEEIRRFGYGPIEDVTYGMQFQDMTLGFIVSRNSFQFKLFNEWMNFTTNFKSYGGSNMIQKDLKSGMSPYEVSYKEDYAIDQMNIIVYDRANVQTLVYEIYDVFPIAINATDISWGDADQLMRLYVRFAYTDYTIKTPQLPVVPTKAELDLKAAQEAQARKDKKKKIKSSGTAALGAQQFGAAGAIDSSNPAVVKTGDGSAVKETQVSLNTYPATNNGYRQISPETREV